MTGWEPLTRWLRGSVRQPRLGNCAGGPSQAAHIIIVAHFLLSYTRITSMSVRRVTVAACPPSLS
jgi:hypothetical protein